MKPPVHSSPSLAADDAADTGQPLLQAARELQQPEPGPALDTAILRAAAERAAEVRKARAEAVTDAITVADLPKTQKTVAASESVRKHSILERFSRWLLGDGETRGHLGQAVAASVFMGIAVGVVLQAPRENTLSPALSERDIVIMKPEETPTPAAEPPATAAEKMQEKAAALERESIAEMAAQPSAYPEARSAAPSGGESPESPGTPSRAAITGSLGVPPAAKPASPPAPGMEAVVRQEPSPAPSPVPPTPFLTPHLSDSASQPESTPPVADALRLDRKPELSSVPPTTPATPAMASSSPPLASEAGGTKGKMSSAASPPSASPQKPLRAQQETAPIADAPATPVASSPFRAQSGQSRAADAPPVPAASSPAPVATPATPAPAPAPEMSVEMSEARKMSPVAASPVSPRTQEKMQSVAAAPAMPAASAPAQAQMPKNEEAVPVAAAKSATAPVPEASSGNGKMDREANSEAVREADWETAKETIKETEIKSQLKRILELRRAGKEEEAQALLRQLRARYPKGDIDGRLRQLEKLEGRENR